MRRKKRGFLREHSLSLVAAGILILWVVLYSRSDPETHAGAFFGNAVADWTGVVMMVVGTKFLFERGSRESKPVRKRGGRLARILEAHSLTLVLVATGIGWLALYLRLDPTKRWGQVVGNVLSEWVQVLGVVLLTKRLFERGSEESKGASGR
ncbi:MAG TPA: hypothetical protein VGH97_06945 [Thermoanaerobaculia bacterium]|jgi:hypothetical protein